MAVIEFTRDFNGFLRGQIVEVGNGEADAYVNYSQSAKYVDREKRETKEVKTRDIPGPTDNRRINK